MSAYEDPRTPEAQAREEDSNHSDVDFLEENGKDAETGRRVPVRVKLSRKRKHPEKRKQPQEDRERTDDEERQEAENMLDEDRMDGEQENDAVPEGQKKPAKHPRVWIDRLMKKYKNNGLVMYERDREIYLRCVIC